MNQAEFGKKLTEIRKSKGLTQLELAEKCEVSLRTIQRIESGKVTPRSFTIKTLSAALEFNFIEEFSNNTPKSKENVEERFILINWIITQTIDLFNLKTNTMKKLTFLSIIIGLIGIGLFSIPNQGLAQKSIIKPHFSNIESIKTISKNKAIDRIKEINGSVDYHNQSLKQLITYASESEYNFDTYVLIAELISSFGHSTKPAMEIANIVFLTDKECDLFNEIAPLIFLHLSGSNDIYVNLAKKASEAKTEEEINEISKIINEYKEQKEFKTLTEAYQNQ